MNLINLIGVNQVWLTDVKNQLIKAGYSLNAHFDIDGDIDLDHFNNTNIWIIELAFGSDSAFDLVAKIKSKYPLSYVFMVSWRNYVNDRVRGLEAGCDEFLSMPFVIEELIIRLQRVFKKQKQMTIDGYTIDFELSVVIFENQKLVLTSKEWELLVFMLNNLGYALDRDKILLNIWGDNYFGSERVVDDTMRRLRKKMPLLKVHTLYGYGYRLH